MLGGCISIFVYTLIAINAVNICSDFINNENQQEVYRVVSEDLKDLGSKYLAENNFHIAVANWFRPEDGRMAFFTHEGDKEGIELESGSCEHIWEYYDSKVDENETKDKQYLFNHLICLNDPRAAVAM